MVPPETKEGKEESVNDLTEKGNRSDEGNIEDVEEKMETLDLKIGDASQTLDLKLGDDSKPRRYGSGVNERAIYHPRNACVA